MCNATGRGTWPNAQDKWQRPKGPKRTVSSRHNGPGRGSVLRGVPQDTRMPLATPLGPSSAAIGDNVDGLAVSMTLSKLQASCQGCP